MFQGSFESKKDICKEFQLSENHLDACFILMATYSQGSYDGQAFVLFIENGKLYEVNAGHCSCYGLEGQWEPEETSAAAIKHRIEKGHLGIDHFDNADPFAQELLEIIEKL